MPKLRLRRLILLLLALWVSTVTQQLTADEAPVSRLIRTDDIDTHVLDYAPGMPGTPMLLLHGAFGSTRLWEGVAKHLSACHRVIVPDMRGRGRTALGDKTLAPEQLSRDMKALLDALRVDVVHVTGHSAGSIVLLQMLQQYPERILTATLVGSPAMVIGETSGPMATLSTDLQRLAAGEEAIDPSLNEFREQWKRTTPEPSRFLDLASRLAARQSFEIDPADSADRRPVMVIRAGKDALIPPDGFTRLAERIRADRIEDFPDGTHQLPRQYAARLATLIEDFVRQSSVLRESAGEGLPSLPAQCRQHAQ